MRHRRSPAGRAGCVAVALLVAPTIPVAAAPPAAPAAPGACRPRPAAEVRFADARLLVERRVRAVDPRNVRERWWACWRPTGRRFLLQDRRHPAERDETSLLAVRR